MESKTSISLTNEAKKRILELSTASDTNQFRIYVTGGGCSGFQYGFKFDSDVAFDDEVVGFNDFSILLDALSYPYLYGSTLDYLEDLAGSRFFVNNPNAKTTCGCGESFAI